MTCMTMIRPSTDVGDEWVTVESPRARLRTPHDELNEALDGLRATLLGGGSGFVVIDTDNILPEDEFDRELAELAATHWDD
jgi:hypothetical protein